MSSCSSDTSGRCRREDGLHGGARHHEVRRLARVGEHLLRAGPSAMKRFSTHAAYSGLTTNHQFPSRLSCTIATGVPGNSALSWKRSMSRSSARIERAQRRGKRAQIRALARRGRSACAGSPAPSRARAFRISSSSVRPLSSRPSASNIVFIRIARESFSTQRANLAGRERRAAIASMSCTEGSSSTQPRVLRGDRASVEHDLRRVRFARDPELRRELVSCTPTTACGGIGERRRSETFDSRTTASRQHASIAHSTALSSVRLHPSLPHRAPRNSLFLTD